METNQIIPINRKQNAAAKAVLKALKALVTFMGCPISHLNHKHTSKHMHTHTLSLSFSHSHSNRTLLHSGCYSNECLLLLSCHWVPCTSEHYGVHFATLAVLAAKRQALVLAGCLAAWHSSTGRPLITVAIIF